MDLLPYMVQVEQLLACCIIWRTDWVFHYLEPVQADNLTCGFIPKTEHHEPEVQLLCCLVNVTYLLDVTPSNSLPYTLSPPPIQLCVIQSQRFGC